MRSWGMRPHALVAVLVAFSGCFGASSGTLSPDADVAFDDPRAIRISGRVVDESYAPLSGVAVRLDPPGRDAVTGPTGDFRFAVAARGLYTLHAEAPGYLPYLADVDTTGGNVQDIVLVLSATPDGRAYRETITRVSHALCHAPTGGGCVATDQVPEGSPDFEYQIPGEGLNELLFEAVWQESVTAGRASFVARNPDGVFLLSCNLTNPDGVDPITRVYYTGPDAGPEGVAPAASPVRFWVKAGQVNADVGGCHEMPTEKGTVIHQAVQVEGGAGLPLGCCGVDVRVTVYLTFFYWQPAADRGFSAIGIE